MKHKHLIGSVISILLLSGVEIAYSGPSATGARPSTNRPFNFSTKRRSTVLSKALQDKKQLEAKKAAYKINVMDLKQDTMSFFERQQQGENPKIESDAIGQVMRGIQLVVKKDKAMSNKQAHTLVKTLLSYSSIKEYKQLERDNTFGNRLMVAVKKHAQVAESLQKLKEKVESKQLKLETGDYENVLYFVASLAEVSPLARSAKNVTAESALLSLGANIGDMVSWQPVSTRNNVMNLLKTYIKERSGSSGPATAFKQTLKRRGYVSLAEQMNRSRDIIENCRI